MKEYDLIVIGSGGGTQISSPAFDLGKRVALIEESKLGGTCLNRGCIPSKMLIHPANVASIIKEAGKFDIKTEFKSANLQKLLRRINHKTDSDSKGIKSWYNQRNKNFDFYDGHGKFVSDKIVEVNGKRITAKKIFIVTGARPLIPPIPGLSGIPFMTSTDALRSRKLPRKLLVIGGGYIACELGYAYSALGSEVHWLVRDKGLLQREDQQLSGTFTKVFSARENVHFNINTTKVEYKNKLFTLHLETNSGKKSKITGDALLVATGVKPNTDQLGLENTKIELTEKGFVKVNNYLETSVKGVYALGDCVGNYLFRHSVNFEGQYLFQSNYLRENKPIKYPPMPHAVFTNPEVGSVGMTEEELVKLKIPYVVGFNLYEKSAMGMARISKDDFVKLLFHKKTRKLLGAHILGEEASDMIHQLVYAMTFGATADNLLEMIYIHPALPEIVRNAARNALDRF
ncbi:MAG TPA: dihydrolipoyl dehydrogenase [Candidatus Nanoarchaeia archaeon]|nr:dihydrolipoyl dehydrogenase [Candidatus Nanoarchaeia archaeon]